jgi:hypothetical protein
MKIYLKQKTIQVPEITIMSTEVGITAESFVTQMYSWYSFKYTTHKPRKYVLFPDLQSHETKRE